MACPSCGSEVPELARFCPACGHAVTSQGDERRLATVLFADVVGFTGLSETLDPEHLKNLIDRCFAALALDVTGHGGRVDKVVGDAIMALFGAPVAHEDDAERAVRAGLLMQRTIAVLAAELGLPLRLRVGINTGEVLVGAMRAGGDYTAMGDVVNVASRLQTMAEPGTVVVGEQTHAATSLTVGYDPLGPMQARGREAPVPAWRVRGISAPPGRRPRRSIAPLVGRDDELLLLRHSVAAGFRRSRPTFCLIVGEAGVGKTRLAEEVAADARSGHGALVLEGRCLPYGEVNPWWPIAEAVRRACGVEPGDSAEVTAARVRATAAEVCGTAEGDPAAGLLYLIGESDALPDVDPHRGRQEARRSLLALLGGLARRQPVLLGLSELHWADDVVLDLLGFHLDRLNGMPVVVLATSRPDLLERWTAPQGRHDLLSLHLDPLPAGAAAELAGILSGQSLPGEVVDTLVVRSGGNPLFLEELVAFVRESGRTGEETLSRSDLPATLRGLVAERLDTLPRPERSLLEDAAVIGHSGTVRVLSSLGGPDAEPEALLPRLYERDLLAPGNHGWEFRSEVVREVVYETLTKSARARRHWAVGEWLSAEGRRTGRSDEMLELVAHHYATAAELVRAIGPVPPVPSEVEALAVDALEKAAGWASRRELPRAAARLLDRAVPLAPPGSPTRLRLLVERASQRATMRELAAARDDLEPVLDASDASLRARALTVLGTLQQLEGDLPASLETLVGAIELWRSIGDRAGEGEALRRYGIACFQAEDTCGAEAALVDALEIARELCDRRDEAWALWHLAELSFQRGDPTETLERLDRAGQAFAEAGDTGGLGWVKGLLGYIRFVQGRREEAEKIAVRILEDTRDRGDPWALAMILLLLASVRLWQGHAAAAKEPALEALRTFRAIHEADGELRATGILGRSLAATGRAAEARALLDEVSERLGVPRAHPLLSLAGLLTHLGDGRSGLEASEPGQAGMWWSEEASILHGLSLLQVGRPAEACARLEALVAGESRVATSAEPGLRANAYAVLALARVCAGDPEGAVQAADRTLESAPVATYRDVVLARLARAFAAHRRAAGPEAQTELAAAGETAAGTDDVVTQAVVGLAGAWIGGGSDAMGPARIALLDVGAVPEGWDQVFAAAAAGLPETGGMVLEPG